MGRGKALLKEKDLILREHLRMRSKSLNYRQVDSYLQDCLVEIFQQLRFKKTNAGYAKTIYGGAYFKQLKKTCIKIINTIDRFEAGKQIQEEMKREKE